MCVCVYQWWHVSMVGTGVTRFFFFFGWLKGVCMVVGGGRVLKVEVVVVCV